jgi:hypothetical protein
MVSAPMTIHLTFEQHTKGRWWRVGDDVRTAADGDLGR